MSTETGPTTIESLVERLTVTKRTYRRVATMSDAPLVAYQPPVGRTRRYRLTRMSDHGTSVSLAGVRVNRAGRIVGRGGMSYICDVTWAGEVVGDSGASLRVIGEEGS